MLVNNKDYDVNKLTSSINFDENFIKDRGNGLYLSDRQVVVLRNVGINYENYSNVNSLILAIEEVLNNDFSDNYELEELSLALSSFNYYNNTTK